MLFEELAGHSGFMNLGFIDAGGGTDDVSEAQRRLVRKIAEAARFAEGMSALDAGCGLGGPARQISSEFGCRVTGMDPGPFQRSRLRRGRGRSGGKGTFDAAAGDAHELPFRSGSFDRVYSIESAFHYADKRRFVRECAAVLRKDGVLAIADILLKPGRSNRRWPVPAIERALEAPGFFSLKHYEDAAEAAGFRLSAAEDISCGVGRALKLWRRNFRRVFKTARKRYSLPTLLKIGAALSAAPVLAGLSPFQYVIMVFEAGKDAS
jgi:cyclopropane fatty-acyl-phospholipid synthase-like methyltransferase